ncbi:conserved hypothetical protein [Desulforapulum autotrophicum HRM2]|uniref:Pyridoxamine 5'-phosphate oxidase N-terminal domain-containing protein n=1 Tax=Desulforapulum autotrophicum (strain ATCC 43914 / DSM 3382 / VKM B-1955 / HRM2) TaxID=177437 RepID=C0QDT5_DESAH|nr:pyridoxamine 5'-phosphate oxidase family protein [Desulforapulum autotrophicum]ACN17356.1 conserved hypothetical protein [Desulforapulum autotrophicum HRM2]
MDDHRKTSLEQITALFDSQQLAVLSTQKNDQPYASLVAFAASEDLEQILFLTPNTTRKYEHLTINPKVAILVNNSRNQAEDIYNAISVTGTGTASVVEKSDPRNFLGVFLKKHPHLKGFSSAPTTALVCVTMNRYFMVNQFQNVVELGMMP